MIVALPGLFSYLFFHMWRLFGLYLLFISPSGASGGPCFVIVAFFVGVGYPYILVTLRLYESVDLNLSLG